MLATLTDDRFSDPPGSSSRSSTASAAWSSATGAAFGFSLATSSSLNRQLSRDRGGVRAEPAGDFVLDGEIVAFEGTRTSFARLQQRMQLRDPARANGPASRCSSTRSTSSTSEASTSPRFRCSSGKLLLRARALVRRAAALHRRTASGTARQLWRDACANGWEGLIAKRADSPYEHGRSRDWLKFKCVNEQELVIGGCTEPRRHRRASAPCCSATTTAVRSSTRARSAPASTSATLNDPLDAPRLPAPRATRRSPTPTASRGVTLGRARTRRADRVHRVDARRAAPPSALPRPAARQGGARRRQRAAE